MSGCVSRFQRVTIPGCGCDFRFGTANSANVFAGVAGTLTLPLAFDIAASTVFAVGGRFSTIVGARDLRVNHLCAAAWLAVPRQ